MSKNTKAQPHDHGQLTSENSVIVCRWADGSYTREDDFDWSLIKKSLRSLEAFERKYACRIMPICLQCAAELDYVAMPPLTE